MAKHTHTLWYNRGPFKLNFTLRGFDYQPQPNVKSARSNELQLNSFKSFWIKASAKLLHQTLTNSQVNGSAKYLYSITTTTRI